MIFVHIFAILLLFLPYTTVVEPDGKAVTDRASYGPGSIVYVTIIDENFNRSTDVIEAIDLTQIVEGEPIIEIVVTQPNEGKVMLSAVQGSFRDESGNLVRETVESGSDTARFEFLIKLPDTIEASSYISVIYNDPFELSPTQRESVMPRQGVVLTDIRMTDPSGKPIENFAINEKVIITSIVSNRMMSEQSYAYLVQVKNSEGITVLLSSISGRLERDRSETASIAWMPERPGNYTIEIFLWDDLVEPSPLIPKIEKSDVRVN